MTDGIRILGVRGLPEVAEGDDIGGLIASRIHLEPGDVVVVAQKIVSKAEAAVVDAGPEVRSEEDTRHARRELARQHARRIVADTPWVLVTETAHGLVCANGGIDGSNAPDGVYVLLPEDPDASARQIRHQLRELVGFDVPVIVTDTFGRPWRMGQTDVAIGLSGLAPIRDERGDTDRAGMVLDVTEAAVADELAAAADLVRRKADGVPVVVVRGFAWEEDDNAGIARIVRPAGEDMFRRGVGMLALEFAGHDLSAGRADDTQPAGLPLDEIDLDLVRRIGARTGATVAAKPGASSTTLVVEGDRLAAGLIVAALRDLDRAVSWRDGEDAVLIDAYRRAAGR